jgi:uncharacterized protein DUF6933
MGQVMVTLRCTKKLLRQLRTAPSSEPRQPTTALGDWYATLVGTRPHPMVLCVSELSLLSVILPVRDLVALTSRFQKGVREHLVVLGASLHDVEREAAAMHQIELGPTVSRSVRGSMGELTFAVEDALQRERFPTREELQRYLSTYIMGAIGMRYPYEVALELLCHPRKDS